MFCFNCQEDEITNFHYKPTVSHECNICLSTNTKNNMICYTIHSIPEVIVLCNDCTLHYCKKCCTAFDVIAFLNYLELNHLISMMPCVRLSELHSKRHVLSRMDLTLNELDVRVLNGGLWRLEKFLKINNYFNIVYDSMEKLNLFIDMEENTEKILNCLDYDDEDEDNLPELIPDHLKTEEICNAAIISEPYPYDINDTITNEPVIDLRIAKSNLPTVEPTVVNEQRNPSVDVARYFSVNDGSDNNTDVNLAAWEAVHGNKRYDYSSDEDYGYLDHHPRYCFYGDL